MVLLLNVAIIGLDRSASFGSLAAIAIATAMANMPHRPVLESGFLDIIAVNAACGT